MAKYEDIMKPHAILRFQAFEAAASKCSKKQLSIATTKKKNFQGYYARFRTNSNSRLRVGEREVGEWAKWWEETGELG